jgi:hypothetical protein
LNGGHVPPIFLTVQSDPLTSALLAIPRRGRGRRDLEAILNFKDLRALEVRLVCMRATGGFWVEVDAT